MINLRKILILVVSTLSFTFSVSHAEEASIDGNVLAIPVLQVGADFYSVQLTLHFETDPIEFSLLAANPLSSASDIGASSFANNILTIPALTYEGVSYNLQLALVGQEPILFQLHAAGVNEEDPTSLSLFTENISSQIIQLSCIVCHTTTGIASATLSTSRIQYLTSIEPDHLQTNYNSLVDFINNVPGGSESILSKPLGIDHVGAAQMVSTSEVYLQFQEFVNAVLSE
jgi:hypothetical protein